jgi:hypothetical protein
MVVEIDGRERELTAEDRCDRCFARALVETVMLGGGVLMWCAHHYASYQNSLRDLGARIVADAR